jgi:hypothetical protein
VQVLNPVAGVAMWISLDVSQIVHRKSGK